MALVETFFGAVVVVLLAELSPPGGTEEEFCNRFTVGFDPIELSEALEDVLVRVLELL